MFTPKELEAVPNNLARLYRELQLNVMTDIVRRLTLHKEITRTTDWEIFRLYELGASKRAIKKCIKDALKLTTPEINRIYKNVLELGYARYEPIFKKTGRLWIPFDKNDWLKQLIEAAKAQTEGDFFNITQSLGFAVRDLDGTLRFKPVAKYYQDILDRNLTGILSGAFDYNKMLKKTVKEMTKSGLRTVDYASGWQNRVEVAARRAVVTGFNQVVAKINEKNAEQLGTNTFEVSWHSGHRPSHWWGGRWFTYEQLQSVCGLGEVDGLCGANCYHSYSPVIPGVSTPTYSKEELERMEAEEKIKREYVGKSYTKYEALQRQRALETRLRKEREEIKLLEEGGAGEDDINAEKARYHAISNEYAEFSEQMKLPQQRERVAIDGLKGVDVTFGN